MSRIYDLIIIIIIKVTNVFSRIIYTPRKKLLRRVLLFIYSSSTGINLQITAIIDPIIAIQTTETAEGTLTKNSGKCKLANKNPNALDFIAVSIAHVLHVVSEYLNIFIPQYPSAPPSKCNKNAPTCNFIPAFKMPSAHWATDPPTKITVMMTPTIGQNGSTVRHVFGVTLFKVTPNTTGTKTTLIVLIAIPIAFTSTIAPNANLQINGVIKMHPIVVAVVINTDNATSPFAMYAHKFDAWPPLMLPTKIKPANNGPLKPMALPMTKANAGIAT